MTKNSSSKKSSKTSGSLPSTRGEEDSSRHNVPRTLAGAFPRTDPDDNKKEKDSSSSHATGSSSDEGMEGKLDSHGGSDNRDPKEEVSEISMTSTKKTGKRRRRNRKNKKKGEEEKESVGTIDSASTDVGDRLQAFQDSVFDAFTNLAHEVKAISEQVQAHTEALSKPKDTVQETNPFLQQLAIATQETDWRDIIGPRKLHVEELSANKQVDRSDNVLASNDISNSPVPDANTPPLNKNKDSSPNPNSNPPDRIARNNTRSNSEQFDKYISKVYNDLDSSTAAARRNRVVIMRQEKDCHVKIRKLELGTVATAAREIMEFQEVEQTPVNMMKVLDPSVRDYLKIKYSVSPADFASWDISDLLKIMARETIVSNQIAFYDQLKSALRDKKVMPWSAVTPQNHERFYLQQVRFVDEFKTVLKLMLAGNATHCPPTKLKDKGLLKLFRELNNPEYFDHVYIASLHSKKFDNMFTFLDKYLKAAHEHYQMSILVKDLPYNFNEVHKSKQNSQRQEAYYHTKRDITKQLDKKTNYNFNKSSNRSTSKFNQRSSSGSNRDRKELNHITSTQDNSDDDDDEVWRNVGPEGQTQDYQDEDSVSIASNETKSDIEDDDNQDNIANTADDDFDQQLAAMESSNHPSSDKNNSSSNSAPYACLKKILTGKCDKPNCRYDHNPHRLREAAQDVVSKANNYLKSQQSKPASSKPTLMVRDKGKFNN